MATIIDSTPSPKQVEPIVLTEKVEALSAMAIGMAHDLNNLLAAIIGNASIISRELPSDSPLMKNAHQIITSANRTLELTNQLQAYTGRGDFNLDKLDINALIGAILPGLREASPPGIDIQYNPGNAIPLICADDSQIKLLLSNIIHNASEAILEGRGSLTISTGTIQTGGIKRDPACLDDIPENINHVYVEIKDTGCGMSPETISKMFDPFFTTKIRGRGLGLSVALGILRAHGSGIAVTSELGKGSTITVMLPACA